MILFVYQTDFVCLTQILCVSLLYLKNHLQTIKRNEAMKNLSNVLILAILAIMAMPCLLVFNAGENPVWNLVGLVYMALYVSAIKAIDKYYA